MRPNDFLKSYMRRPLHQRLWQGAFALAVFVVTFIVGNALIPANKAVNTHMLGLDFLAFYTGGSLVQSGRVAELYNLESIHTFQRAVAAAGQLQLGDNFGPFWNPPFYALVFVPLAKLPYRTALAVWECLGVCAWPARCCCS